MRFSTTLLASALALSFFTVEVMSVAHEPRRHQARVLDTSIDTLAPNVTLDNRGIIEKRFDNSRFTYYATGLGACGKWNRPSDFIVALNQAQWNGGAHCFDSITISYKGKSTSAQITDECPGCPFGGLDMSEGLFSYFASEDEGVIYGEWNFGSAAVAPAPAPIKHTTTKWKPTPTSIWVAPTTTAHRKSSTTFLRVAPSTTIYPKSKSSLTTSTSSSTNSISGSSVAPSSSAAVPSASTVGSLGQVRRAFVQLGLVVTKAGIAAGTSE